MIATAKQRVCVLLHLSCFYAALPIPVDLLLHISLLNPFLLVSYILELPFFSPIDLCALTPFYFPLCVGMGLLSGPVDLLSQWIFAFFPRLSPWSVYFHSRPLLFFVNRKEQSEVIFFSVLFFLDVPSTDRRWTSSQGSVLLGMF